MKYKLNVYKKPRSSLFLNSPVKKFGLFLEHGKNNRSFNEFSSNDYLKKLSSPESINPIDPYWNQLLFSPPLYQLTGKLTN